MMPFVSRQHQPLESRPPAAPEAPQWALQTGLLLIGGLLALSPLLQGGTTHQAVMIIRSMILLMLGLWLLRGIQTGFVPLPRLPIAPTVASFLGLALVLTLFSPYVHQSFQWFLVLLSYTAFLYFLASFLTGWHHVATLLVVIGAVGLLEVAWTIVQAGWLGAVRPSGSFFNPNFLAGYLAAISTIGLGVMCYARVGPSTWRGTGLQARIVVIACATFLVLMLVVILWTGSRGGALALVGGTAVVLSLRYRWKGLGILVAFLVVGVLIPNPVRDRFSAEYFANPVGYARWHIWQSSIQAMAEHPFGVGLGLYQYFSPRYMFPVEGQIMQYGRVARTAHNEYLQMGVELGVAGVLIFCWGLLAVGREARRALSHRLRRWHRGALVGVIGATVAILVHGFVDSNLHSPAVAILLVSCVGIILLARRLSPPNVEPVRVVPVRSRVWSAAVAVVIIGGLSLEVARLGGAWMSFEAGSRAMAKQDVSRAIAHYERAVAWDPGKALYHSSLAAAHFKIFKRTQSNEAARTAVVELETAISINPVDGRLRGLLGHVYSTLASASAVMDTASPVRSGQRFAWLRAASSAYRQALEREPYSPFYRLELAKISLALGDRKEAQAVAKEAVDLEPNFLPGRVWLAHLYIQSGRIQDAHWEYQEIVERRRRYADWAKNSIEERFLGVDVAALGAALHRGSART